MQPHLADLAIDAFLACKRSQQLPLSPVIYFEALSKTGSTVAGPSASSKGNGKQRSRQAHLGDAYEIESDEESDSDGDTSSDEDEEDILETDGWRANGIAADDEGTETASRSSRYACCHIVHNALHFLAPIRGDCNLV